MDFVDQGLVMREKMSHQRMPIKFKKTQKQVHKISPANSLNNFSCQSEEVSPSPKRKPNQDYQYDQQKLGNEDNNMKRETPIQNIRLVTEGSPKNTSNYFFDNFKKFFQQAIQIPEEQIKFRYIKELFNIELDQFPLDQEILDIQSQIANCAQSNVTKLKKNWSDDEKKVLVWIIGKLSAMKALDIRNISDTDWDYVANLMNRRDGFQAKQKWLQMLKIPLQQAPWTPEEDLLLKQEILKFQQLQRGNKWSQIAGSLNRATNSNVHRNGKQCRERWNNFLNPNLNRKPWNDEEDLDLLKQVLNHGKRWASISKNLVVQRSENAVKNRFNCLIKKEKNQLTKLEFNLLEEGSGEHSPHQIEELSEENIRLIQSLVQKLEWRINQFNSISQAINQKGESLIKLEENKPSCQISNNQTEDQRIQVNNLTEAMELMELDQKSNTLHLQPEPYESITNEDFINGSCCVVNQKRGVIFLLSPEQLMDFISIQRQQLFTMQGVSDMFDMENDFKSQKSFFMNRTLNTIDEQLSYPRSLSSLPNLLGPIQNWQRKNPSIVMEHEKILSKINEKTSEMEKQALKFSSQTGIDTSNRLTTSNAIGTSPRITTSIGQNNSFGVNQTNSLNYFTIPNDGMVYPVQNFAMNYFNHQNSQMLFGQQYLQSFGTMIQPNLQNRARTDIYVSPQQLLNSIMYPNNSSPNTNLQEIQKRQSFRIQSLSNCPEQ